MSGILGAFLAIATGAAAQDARVSTLVPPSAMHAVEGITLGADRMLYATSIHGQAVYRIDPRNGAVTIAVPTPMGESDDVAFGPPGTPAAGILAWTAQRSGEIRMLRPGAAAPEVLLRDVPRVNPIAFDARGRLFTAQVGAGDEALWELDPVGGRAARRIETGAVRLNGFGFGPDGKLYAPNFGADRIVAIDVDAGRVTTVATGLGAPAAVKANARGKLYSVDYLKGDLWHTDPASGASRILASFPAPLDSLALADDGRIFLSSAADSSILVFDARTRRSRVLVRGHFTMTLGMARAELEGREALVVADPFGYRFVETRGGRIVRPAWQANRGASYAIAADAQRIAWSYALGGMTAGRVRLLDRTSDALLLDSKIVAQPRGVALATDAAAVLVADAAEGRILRIAADGDAAEPRVIATGLQRPVGLARDPGGGLLVTEFAAGRVLHVDESNGRVAVLATGLDRPTGAVRMADGRVAVVEAEAGRVSVIESGRHEPIARGLATSLAGLDLPADTPSGIVVSADGTLHLACPANNSIVRIQVARAASSDARMERQR